jgi:probable HAF family extracellular repeat protein
MVRALSLLALGALSMPALACGESSRPTQATSGGQTGDNGGASAGDAASGGTTAAGQRAKLLVIDVLQDHALQSGENPLDFERSTFVNLFNSDASVIVGVSAMRPLSNPSQPRAAEAFRWTETSGVVGLGFAPGPDVTDPRSLVSSPYCVSLDGSTVAGLSGVWSIFPPDVFLWTEASGMTNLGQVPGAFAIQLRSASSDCGVLVGTAVMDDQSHIEAVRWSASSGWQRLGWLPGDSDSDARYGSPDGAIVIGSSRTDSASHGYRWTEGTGMTSLGQLPAFPSCIPTGATPDARVVVGDCSTGTVSQAFRWTEEAGMVSLGSVPGSTGSSVGGVSADGTVVVGDFYDAQSNPQAFRWTQATGMVELGLLAGYKQASLSQLAQAMNADGTVLVGSANDGKKVVPFRWTEATGPVVLQPLPGDDTTYASGPGVTSLDGTVVAGLSGQRDANAAWSVSNAVVWDDQGAAHSIAQSLTDAGVDLNGFHLDHAFVAPVAGQTVLYGQGKGTDGSRAWVAWLP